jgi:hypothetical protein
VQLTRYSTVIVYFGLNKINRLSDINIIKLSNFSPIGGVRLSIDTAWTQTGHLAAFTERTRRFLDRLDHRHGVPAFQSSADIL